MQRHTSIGFSLIIFLAFAVSATAQTRGDRETSEQKPVQTQTDPAVAAKPENKFQFMHGRISYRKKGPEGFERGREDWSLTHNRDGSRTLRTLSMTDDSKFVRDVTYTIDTDARPLRAFVQLQVDDQLVGSGYFQVTGDRMTIVTDGVDTGHTMQVIPVPKRFHVMTHALMADGWPALAFEGKEPGTQTFPSYSTSPSWDGTSGPLGYMTTQDLTLVGSEQVTVPAGKFQAQHYIIGDDADPLGASHIWVTGEHNILVKYDWPAFGMEYMLESLIVEPQTDLPKP